MARGEMSLKPKMGSSSALRNEALTTFKICAVGAALRLLYRVTASIASVWMCNATAMAAAAPRGWGGTRMHRDVKRYAGPHKILGIVENHGEVTEEATAANGRNGTSVGVELSLQQLEGRVGRFADNGGERFMWKREFGGRRHIARIVDLVDTMSGTDRSAGATFRRRTVVVSDASVVEGLCSSVDELNRDGA